MKPDNKPEYGRFLIKPSLTMENTSVFYLENINHTGDFWLTVCHEMDAKKGVIGFLKFKEISPNMFVLNDIRPAHCPIRDSSILCKGPVIDQPEGS